MLSCCSIICLLCIEIQTKCGMIHVTDACHTCRICVFLLKTSLLKPNGSFGENNVKQQFWSRVGLCYTSARRPTNTRYYSAADNVWLKSHFLPSSIRKRRGHIWVLFPPNQECYVIISELRCSDNYLSYMGRGGQWTPTLFHTLLASVVRNMLHLCSIVDFPPKNFPAK